jgi:hypothetical protein
VAKGVLHARALEQRDAHGGLGVERLGEQRVDASARGLVGRALGGGARHERVGADQRLHVGAAAVRRQAGAAGQQRRCAEHGGGLGE